MLRDLFNVELESNVHGFSEEKKIVIYFRNVGENSFIKIAQSSGHTEVKRICEDCLNFWLVPLVILLVGNG